MVASPRVWTRLTPRLVEQVLGELEWAGPIRVNGIGMQGIVSPLISLRIWYGLCGNFPPRSARHTVSWQDPFRTVMREGNGPVPKYQQRPGRTL